MKTRAKYNVRELPEIGVFCSGFPRPTSVIGRKIGVRHELTSQQEAWVKARLK